MTKHILLYTSGIDSYIGYYYLKHVKGIDDLYTIYFDLGHKYAKYEIEYIKKSRPETIIVDDNKFGVLLEKMDAHIPNRNALLVLLADSYFYSPGFSRKIYIGGLKDDNVNDNNQLFASLMTSLLQAISNSKVESVFDYELSKVDIVDWYIQEYGGKVQDLIDNTFSCYQPVVYNGHHCYSCNACFRRNVALSNYITLPFYNDKLLNEYYNKAKQGVYTRERNKQIIKYVERLRK